MKKNSLKLQHFRKNDLVDDGGKQFELGKAWCSEFFGIDKDVKTISLDLVFKALTPSQMPFNDKIIKLDLAEESNRGDRKAYANNESGFSNIKNLFINDLQLDPEQNIADYFGVYINPNNDLFLYVIPHLMYENFIRFFELATPNVTINEVKQKENIGKFPKGPRQIIYYGAPGTGKSFEVDMKTKGHSTVRTTFHPDTDYSTFVGAYKPVMTTEDIKVVPVVIGEGGVTFNKNEGSLKEQRITYKFVRQAFLKAYLAAWKKYAEAAGNDVEPQFLVIEEINRGNCAQIFGDLFQLLDREGNGFSKYPIEADSDLTREINTALNEEENGEYRLDKESKIDVEGVVDKYTSSTGHTLSEDIQQGRVLLLPPNLYIWATMNTSDQSLFPIDSAFKRRWTWKYTKIAEGYKRNANGEYVKGPDGKRIPLGWQIEGADYTLDWWTFVQAINKAIGGEGSAEDKKLGYFFCKPDNDIYISEDTFVGKVMFYLWNDVFKDSDTKLFKVTDDDPTFDTFYKEDDNGYTIVNSEAVKRFLRNLLGEKADKIESKATTTAVNSDAGTNNSETAEAEEE